MRSILVSDRRENQNSLLFNPSFKFFVPMLNRGTKISRIRLEILTI